MTPSWLTRRARLSGKAGRQGGVAGRVVAGQVGWLSGERGGPGGRKGMDLRSKECSGVNIVT